MTTTQLVSFVAHGVPAPQGSKNQFGGESNPRTKPWRANVCAAAGTVMNGSELLDGPLRLTVLFYFPYRKGDLRTNGEVKDSASVFHSVRPDTDKLVRAIGDALTGVVYRDDSQIAEVRAAKLYDRTARAEVTIEPASGLGVWTLP